MQWDYLLNYPLKRVKTKDMPNPKNMPFLMCPTRRTGALGGTPLTRSEAGGHIKKGAWVNAHDAALLALAHLLERSHEGAAQVAEQDDEEEPDGQGGGHGGLGGCLLVWGARLDERFERHLAFGEVAHGEHEFRRNAVISHLSDAARRDAESISKRFGSAALTFEPRFEIHGWQFRTC